MFRNYFMIAIRNLIRNKLHSLINILGLAISFTVTILITFWVLHEFSYDQFHEKIEHIYMVPSFVHYGPQKSFSTGTPPALAPAIEQEYPEILRAARINNGQGNILLQYQNKAFKEGLTFLDPAMFDIFSFPFIYGSFEGGDSDNHVLALSESEARKIFGDRNPVGQTVQIDEKYTFTIAGVFEDIPSNSSLKFDMVAPLTFLEEYWGKEEYTRTWYNCSFRSYVLLRDGTDVNDLSNRLSGRCQQENPDSDIEPLLYPYKDLYLVLYGYRGHAMIFVYICLFIILIAVINFTNLSTAAALKRSREIGIRKVHGSSRMKLILQFMGESILIAFSSLLISFLLVELALPFFNSLTGESFSLESFFTLEMGLITIGITLLTGILAGIYPAFLLSSFNPIQVLNNPDFKVGGKSVLRKFLVVTQYVLSSVLFICLIVIMQQTRFMMRKDLGFKRDHLVVVPVEGNLVEHRQAWKSELLSKPDIYSATFSSHLPTGIWWNSSGWDWEGRPEDLVFLVTFLNVDYDYLKTMQIELKMGSFFSDENFPHNTRNVVINQSFADEIGVENPIGMTLSHQGESVTVIGVIEDFHYKALQYRVEPIMLMCFTKEDFITYLPYNYLTMRISSQNIPATLKVIEKITRNHNPHYPFNYFFLDDKLKDLYDSSQRFMTMVGTFAVLALFISSLGLFGLVSYTTEQRTREISIRKVLGASITRISIGLILDFSKWVLIANLFAWPVAWWLMRKFLSDYPYQVEITLLPFVLTAAVTFVIAVATVSWHTIRTAFTAPAKTLKYE